MIYKYIKRILDIISSLLAILILSPLLAVTAVLVKTKLGSPVLFKQERPGKDEKIFTLMKFRTMTDERDENGELLPDEVRLTKFGKFLRSTSIDELPELFNILKGDMSVIGPRPLLPRDVAYMNDEQLRRHTVRPGLTGLSQSNGRNEMNWDTKLSSDVDYVDNISLLLDIKILFATVISVLKREGITFDEGADIDLKDWNELKKQKKLNEVK